jgi:hypothetical protein
VVEAENENTLLAGGFWVLNLQVPAVGTKPVPEIVPVPLTARSPSVPWWVMVDVARLNVNPPTLQRAGLPEPKIQGAVIATEVPTGTDVKLPDRLTTVGGPPLPFCHPVTRVAVLTLPVLS